MFSHNLTVHVLFWQPLACTVSFIGRGGVQLSSAAVEPSASTHSEALRVLSPLGSWLTAHDLFDICPTVIKHVTSPRFEGTHGMRVELFLDALRPDPFNEIKLMGLSGWLAAWLLG
jgi:hypothetical protein